MLFACVRDVGSQVRSRMNERDAFSIIEIHCGMKDRRWYELGFLKDMLSA